MVLIYKCPPLLRSSGRFVSVLSLAVGICVASVIAFTTSCGCWVQMWSLRSDLIIVHSGRRRMLAGWLAVFAQTPCIGASSRPIVVVWWLGGGGGENGLRGGGRSARRRFVGEAIVFINMYERLCGFCREISFSMLGLWTRGLGGSSAASNESKVS